MPATLSLTAGLCGCTHLLRVRIFFTCRISYDPSKGASGRQQRQRGCALAGPERMTTGRNPALTLYVPCCSRYEAALVDERPEAAGGGAHAAAHYQAPAPHAATVLEDLRRSPERPPLPPKVRCQNEDHFNGAGVHGWAWQMRGRSHGS